MYRKGRARAIFRRSCQAMSGILLNHYSGMHCYNAKGKRRPLEDPPRASRPAILIGVFTAIHLTPFRRAGFVDAALTAGAAFFLA